MRQFQLWSESKKSPQHQKLFPLFYPAHINNTRLVFARRFVSLLGVVWAEITKSAKHLHTTRTPPKETRSLISASARSSNKLTTVFRGWTDNTGAKTVAPCRFCGVMSARCWTAWESDGGEDESSVRLLWWERINKQTLTSAALSLNAKRRVKVSPVDVMHLLHFGWQRYILGWCILRSPHCIFSSQDRLEWKLQLDSFAFQLSRRLFSFVYLNWTRWNQKPLYTPLVLFNWGLERL